MESRPKEELYDLENDPHQTVNQAHNPSFKSVLNEHREVLDQWEAETDDKGRYPESHESLKLVFKSSQGKCVNPEYDFLKLEPGN